MVGRGLSERIVRARLTVPRVTLPAVPVTFRVDVGGVVLLRQTRVIIPQGHAGLTGFRVDYSGTTILPYSGQVSVTDFAGTQNWLTGNDADWLFDTGDIEIGRFLDLYGFNNDGANHVFEVHFAVRDKPIPSDSTSRLGAI